MDVTSIVYDIDGVLVRAGELGKLLQRDYGIDPEEQLRFFQGPFRECVRGRADLKDVLPPFLDEWGWQRSTEDFLDTWFEADSALNEDVLSTVPELRRAGYRCYVASTQEAHRASYLENVVGLGPQFDGLYFSCHVGTTKDDPKFFDHVARAIRSSPEEILFLDDTEAIVETARAAGWGAEVYRFGDDITRLLSSHGVRVPDV